MIDDRTHRVLHALLPGDYRRLRQHYAVEVDAENRGLDLTDIELPPSWEPGTITVQIKLPAHFPQAAPRWEFPGTMRRDGAVPRHLLVAGNWLVRGTLGDPWIYWPRQWDPQQSSLVDETKQALADLTEQSEPDLGVPEDA